MCKQQYTQNNLKAKKKKTKKLSENLQKQTHYERGSYPLSLFYNYFHIHKFIFSHTQIQDTL